MRLFIVAVVAAFAALPVSAQTLSPLTGSDGITPQHVPDTGRTDSSASGATRPARARHQRLTAQQRFDEANTSHDGKLTLEQARAANMTRVADNFDAIDAKKNGYVTFEDIRAYNKAQRAARRASKQ